MGTDKIEYTILVIEDNPGDFALVEDFLFEQIAAPQILHATSFKEAREILIKEAYKLDVVLLDLSLPDHTGESLINEIVETCKYIPVIVLTGYTDFAFGVKSLSLGISDYLLKDELTALSLYKSIVYSIERKKNTVALAESERRYSDLFHLSPLPMWVVDLNTLYFLDVNAATINHYGYSRDEFLSMTLKDIRPQEELAKLEHDLLQSKKGPASFVAIHRKKNGELRNIEIRMAPICYNGIGANVVITNDITDRLNYIKAIENQNEKFREISWIQSHLVRSPLSRIMGLTHLICSAKEDDDEVHQMLQYLSSSADELDGMIKTITDKTLAANYQVNSPI